MASSIETTSTTTTLKNNGNTYATVDTNDDVTITNDLAVNGTLNTTGLITSTKASGENKLTVKADAASQQASISLQVQAGTPGQTVMYMGKVGATTNGQVGYNPNNDKMTFFTNNSEKMAIDTSGNVGIGTTAPESDSILELESGSPGPRLRLTNTTAGGKSYKIHSNNTGDLSILGNGNDTRVIVKDSGNVGIGTTDTSLFNGAGTNAKLVVTGSSNNGNLVQNGSAAIAIVNTDVSDENTAGLHFARADTDDTPNYAGASIVAQFKETQATGQYPSTTMNFLTSTTQNAAPSVKMTIAENGTVTLATPLPVASGGTGTTTGAAAFPAGTRMLFQQTAAPTGWTKDTTAAINNGALRTVTGSASTGGTAAFTTAFTSRTPTGTNAASGSTSLTEAQMPAHKHLGGWAGVNGSATFGVASTGGGNVNGQNGWSGSNHAWTSTIGSGSSHNHAAAAFTGSAMDFAVKYYDVIIASKD